MVMQSGKQAADLDTPAVLCEHLEPNGGAKDRKDQHEDDVHAHLPGVRHQVKHPAKVLPAIAAKTITM